VRLVYHWAAWPAWRQLGSPRMDVILIACDNPLPHLTTAAGSHCTVPTKSLETELQKLFYVVITYIRIEKNTAVNDFHND